MSVDPFVEALLSVMEQKDHWAWPAFADGRVARERFDPLPAAPHEPLAEQQPHPADSDYEQLLKEGKGEDSNCGKLIAEATSSDRSAASGSTTKRPPSKSGR